MSKSKRLENAIAVARPEVEAALAEAEIELAQLDRERERLVALMERARVILEDDPDSGSFIAVRSLTLHEAMALVLRDRGNEWTAARDLAHAINNRGLYRKRDGSAVETNQIHARVSNYIDMFEKEGSLIRLREGDEPVTPLKAV